MNDLTNDNFKAIDKIEFKEYTGKQIGTQIQFYDAAEWKTYDTRGEFIIEDKEEMEVGNKISGTINMEVLNGGDMVYKLRE